MSDGVRHHDRVVERLARVELRVAPWTWAFAQIRAREIADHWRQRSAEQPAYFNGPIYLLHEWRSAAGLFTGTLFKTDFATYLYARENRWPDRTVRDCFGSAIVRSRDGQILLGRANGHTMNAGHLYPPGGFIDANDVDSLGAVTIEGSVMREIGEELGLSAHEITRRPGFWLTCHDYQMSIGVEFAWPGAAVALEAVVAERIAQQTRPELAGIALIAAVDDLDGHRIPGFVKPLVEAIFRHDGATVDEG